MKYLCILLIRFYRKYLSPLKRQPCCRFSPTCSAYALEAFKNRGFFVGLFLTVYRILRCNPFCVGGYDPVPEKGIRYKGNGTTDTTDDTPRVDRAFTFFYDLPLLETTQKSQNKKNK